MYPNFDKDIFSFGFVKNITLHANQLGLLIEIPSSSEETSAILRENISRVMGLQNADVIMDPSGKKLIPLKAFGVSVMSMGLLYDEGQSLIWSGPMVMRAIGQMLREIIWGVL
ncbi:P-loop NTPase, partial [Helicobacter pylori]|uniref:P-loop NTPase n=1 Tax=Helicobacter pylori TaxID=210 RepID=UPI00117AF215